MTANDGTSPVRSGHHRRNSSIVMASIKKAIHKIVPSVHSDTSSSTHTHDSEVEVKRQTSPTSINGHVIFGSDKKSSDLSRDNSRARPRARSTGHSRSKSRSKSRSRRLSFTELKAERRSERQEKEEEEARARKERHRRLRSEVTLTPPTNNHVQY